ncbi:MAG: phosphodiester glycosidase family protein [Candidatus Roizmanbacteria bacterium]|nr:phosphodiester glycosidase family protein [Candidatus Roizmanbacteria bacterium]
MKKVRITSLLRTYFPYATVITMKPSKLSYLKLILLSIIAVLAVTLGVLSYIHYQTINDLKTITGNHSELADEKLSLDEQLASISAELTRLQNVDQKLRNDELEEEIDNIQKTYKSAVASYESLLKLKEKIMKTQSYDKLLVDALVYLSERNYASASATLADLDKQIKAEEAKLAAVAVPTVPANVPVNNAPPGSGYSRQTVATEIGNYLVSMHAADLSSARVIVDTASEGTCANECPVLSLGDYVGRNGAFAGINGSYFCPAEYPSCAGKTNSFDTLLMNKNKVYFNSDNNVYSTVPVVIFGNGWVRFEGQSLNWGRDTSVDGVIANQPLLVSGGTVVFGGDGDPKKGSRAGRSFVANRGNTVYIGVVHSATVAETAIVLKALGMDNALNLDSGGSTAFWSGGYKVGPGRNIPNAILFVGK